MATASRSSGSERDRGHRPAESPEHGHGQQHGQGKGQEQDQEQEQIRTRAISTRAQASPTATLVAVAAIGLGLSLYASVLASVAPVPDHDAAGPTLDRVHDAVTSADIADPAQLKTAVTAGPSGYQLQVNLRADGRMWIAGPTPPDRTDELGGARTQTATRPVAVRLGAGTVTSGRLRVVIWR